MAVLEPVVATLLANIAPFTEGLATAKAEMDDFAATAAATGDAAGAGLADGMVAGTSGLSDDLGVVGADAGVALRGGVKDSTSGIEDDMGNLGLLAGGGLSDGVQSGIKEIGPAFDDIDKQLAEGALFNLPALSPSLRNLGEDVEDVGTKAGKSGGLFNILSGSLAGMGGPMGDVADHSGRVREGFDQAAKSGSGFGSALGDIPVPAVIAGAALAGIAAVSVDLAGKYQTTTNQIAASEGITTKAAQGIGNIFLTTAGQVTFSGQAIATAFAGVAGQAKQINGGALSAKQSLDFMRASMDAAEASGTDLGSTTAIIATTLQAFSLGIGQASNVANALYVAENATGQSLTAVGNAIDKVKTKLGGMSPPLSQLSALLVDMTGHGETGRAAMTALSTTFTNFLKPATAVATAQNDLKVATDALPPSLQALAKAYPNMTTAQATAATKDLTTSQAALFAKFTSSQSALDTASQAYAKMGINAVGANGKLLPMGDIIGQLQEKIKGMNTAQAIATLNAAGFSNASAKLVATIQAGPAAYDKDLAAVNAHNTAAIAAAKATSGMKDSFEKAKSAIEDAAIALGEKLMPYVTEAAQDIAQFIAVVVKDWPEISAVIKAVFDIVKPIIVGFIDQIKGIVEILEGIIDFIKDVFTGKWSAAWDAVKKIFDGLVEYLKGSLLRMFGPFTSIIEKGLSDVVGFFAKLPGDVLAALGGAGSWLVSIGSDIINGLWSGIQSIWNTVSGFFTSIGSTIIGWFSGAASWLGTAGGDVISGLWNAIKSAWNAVAGFFGAIGTTIAAWFSDAITWLAKAGGDVINGLWNAIKATWTTVSSFFTSIGSTIAGWFSDAISWLAKEGSDVISGLWRGITVGWKTVSTFFTGMAKTVEGWLKDASTWLVDAGGAVITGFIKGITTGFGLVEKTIKGLGSDVVGWAKDALSIFSPSKEFADIGMNVVAGLAQGITQNAGMAHNAVTQLANGLTGNIALGAIAGGVSPISASSVGGASGNTITLAAPVNINLNGQQLAQIVTQYQLRGARSTGNVSGRFAGSTQNANATGINANAIAR